MLPSWIASYVGKPFQDRGRGPDAYDCYGLVWKIYEEHLGITIPSFHLRYDTAKDQVAVARLFFAETALSSRWRRVDPKDAQPPDVLTAWVVDKDGRHRHVGVMVAPGQFLHVLAGHETVVSRIAPHWAPRWPDLTNSRIDGVYRHEALVLA